jgi:hypothetical protein
MSPSAIRSLVALLLAAAATGAAAQIRPIPSEAQVGNMRHLQFMTVELDGETRELAPGAQIRDIENRIVLPGTLEERQPVRYMLDSAGMVFRVWMLSGQEKEALPPEPSPYPR